jgi:hypothetical protein
MKPSAILLGVAALVGFGCGGDEKPSFWVGTWKGEGAGVSLLLHVYEEIPRDGITHLLGAVSSIKLVCLNRGPGAGTVTEGKIQLAAQGSGSRSGLTLVDFAGELMGDKVTGSLTMTGDDQNEEKCDFDKTPVTFQK